MSTMSQSFLTFEQQADLLIQRGMHSASGLDNAQLKNAIIERLRHISYYRLSPYWSLAQTCSPSKSFHPGTYWEDVIARYMFDRRLRHIVFDAISRIEIAIRTTIAYHWAKETREDSPQQRSNNFAASYKYKEFLSKVNSYYMDNQSEEAVQHRKQYGEARLLPIWIFIEFTTFGNLQKLMDHGFKASSNVVRTVASELGYLNEVDFFLSGIALLKDIRNACAHQSRVWNRRWLSRKGTCILKKSHDPAWKLTWDSNTKSWVDSSAGDTLVTHMESTAAALTFCYRIIKTIAPHSGWKARLVELLSDSESPSRCVYRNVGFSNRHWMEHPLWQ